MRHWYLAPFRFLKGKLMAFRREQAKKALLRSFHGNPLEVPLQKWAASLKEPTEFYLRCFHYFHTKLPDSLRNHREYFTQENRGFGEEAFHVMWFLIFGEFKPKAFLEIGVYRGQTLSLASLLQRQFNIDGFVAGISPFSNAADAVSKYKKSVAYYEDTLKNFAHFQLPAPVLIKAFSTDPEAAAFVKRQQWDCVYIDGNHDYPVARADWELCAAAIKPGGLIVLDDSAMGTDYHPPIFATPGHPGPSQVASEVDPTQFAEILRVGHNRVFQKRVS